MARTLYELQSMMAKAIMRPLENDTTNEVWIDGGNTKDYAAQFIKANNKLSSLERLQIYNQQYWYRLLECLHEDFPGLATLLGNKRFEKLLVAYLNCYPSYSYALTCLGEKLPDFIKQEPKFTDPDNELALEIATLEWAQCRAFDCKEHPPLDLKNIEKLDPASLVLHTQPYLSVFAFKYAVDDFVLSLSNKEKKKNDSNAAINRVIHIDRSVNIKKRLTHLAVYRFENDIYFKHLDKLEYSLIQALMSGKSLTQTCTELMGAQKIDEEALAKKINKSFTTWMELGWFCDGEIIPLC